MHEFRPIPAILPLIPAVPPQFTSLSCPFPLNYRSTAALPHLSIVLFPSLPTLVWWVPRRDSTIRWLSLPFRRHIGRHLWRLRRVSGSPCDVSGVLKRLGIGGWLVSNRWGRARKLRLLGGMGHSVGDRRCRMRSLLNGKCGIRPLLSDWLSRICHLSSDIRLGNWLLRRWYRLRRGHHSR